MNWMDAETLAMHVLGLDEEKSDDADFDDLIYDKFEISMEQFFKVAEALSAFTVPMQAGISGKYFRGFVKDGYFITKTKCPLTFKFSGTERSEGTQKCLGMA